MVNEISSGKQIAKALAKRSLSKLVSNPIVDNIYDLAKIAGAIGGKLSGAGYLGSIIVPILLNKGKVAV